MEDGKSKQKQLVPPDGGYGWIIVPSVLIQYVFAAATIPMFGVIFGSKFKEFETTPTEQTSIIATFLLSWNIITMFVGPLVELRSARFVGFCGTTCIITGLVFCAFSRSTADMMVSYGLVVGAGTGLSTANGILIVSKYFKKKLGIAFGLVSTGVGVGCLVLPQLVTFLLQHFTGDQTILIYASLSSIGFIGTVLSLDVKPFMKQMSVEDCKLFEQKDALLKEKEPNDKKQLQKKKMKESESFLIVKVFRLIKWSLLCEPFFLMIASVHSMVYVCILTYSSQLRTICSEKGLDLAQTANLLSIIAFTEILSKLFLGYLGDRPFIMNKFRRPKKIMFTIASLGTSVCLLGITLAFDFVSLAISICLCTFFICGILVNNPIVYVECFPVDLPSAIGLGNLFRAAIAMILSPIAGMLSSYFGSFNAALYFISGTMFTCMGVWLLVDLVSWCRTRADGHQNNIREVEV